MSPSQPRSGVLTAAASVVVAAAVAMLAPASDVFADTPDINAEASTLFVQAGFAHHTHAVVFGATWPWAWRHTFRGGAVTGYWEASLGRWSTERDTGRSSAWSTQLGVTPVLRWHPPSWGGAWYVEGGIGANLLAPIYRSRDKRFSTTFNFGDHMAIGHRFGNASEHDIALRLQHFSNAGIRHPNPGENFLQLRYAYRY